MKFQGPLVAFLALALANSAQAFVPNAGLAASFVERDTAQPLRASMDGEVTFRKTTHTLYYVEDINYIDKGKPSSQKEVMAFELSNNKGVKVTAMAEGGNMVGLSVGGTEYIWDNVEGACYYGEDSNAFPLKRGLILHGGVRFAAVCAEHGIYYDSKWDMTFTTGSDDGKEKSIILQIQDTQANRDAATNNDPGEFSKGQFNRLGDAEGFLSMYPVTDMMFTYTITLRADEDFVRLNMKVENPTNHVNHAEAWLPMTFPINTKSQIVSEQVTRWRRDEWCFPDLANIVNWGHSDLKEFQKPLDWISPGIFYDFPYKQGTFHGVTTDPENGKGIFYVAPEDTPHYTKMWSWGNLDNFDREEEIKKQPPLGAGRPFTEYYEPWSSGFNFAFFQKSEFESRKSYSWEIALVPIASDGLKSDDNEVLKAVVKNEIAKRGIVDSLSGVRVEDMPSSRL